MPVLVACDDIEDPAREVHDSEAMLESPVRRAGIDQVRQGQLMDVA